MKKAIKKVILKMLTILINISYLILPFRDGIYIGEPRKRKIIVSLTSYPARFEALSLTVKTILYQSCKPDKIILYLVKEECFEIPGYLSKLQKYGLDIRIVNDNLKPHNKYFYSMLEYPDDIIITIDDDVLYPPNMIRRLYESYEKYPMCISAARVHRIKMKNGELCDYNDWDYQYRKILEPSHWLLATGVGGVLFPPDLLPELTLNSTYIKTLCLNADDIWLKFMELKNGVKVVYVPKANSIIWNNGQFHQNGLFMVNVINNENDKYIKAVSQFLNISIQEILEHEK